jgi:predicted nuclease with TOPRIM domain
MAKTSARRPRDTSYRQYADNWDNTFGSPEELVKKRFAEKRKEEMNEKTEKLISLQKQIEQKHTELNDLLEEYNNLAPQPEDAVQIGKVTENGVEYIVLGAWPRKEADDEADSE